MRFYLVLLLSSGAAALGPPHVVVTIKPLHALVAGVMKNVGTPVLLVPPGADEHSFSLRPSQMRELHRADTIFLLAHDFERFMETPLESLHRQEKIREIGKAPELTLYPVRRTPGRGGAGEAPRGLTDYHLWLDPDNAIAMVHSIEQTLSATDPAHAALYSHNAERMEKRLRALDAEIRRLFDAQGKTGAEFMPYLTYHDAYQYFERRYGLAPSAFIVQNPDHPLGAKSVESLQERLKFDAPNCLFAEPQSRATIMHELAAQTGARVRIVDPLGIGTPADEEGYFAMMRALAATFAECSRLQGGLRDFGQ